MGTSVSQGSPATVPWKMVNAAYRNDNIQPENLTKLLFRASGAEAETDLGMMLTEPIIGYCFSIATTQNIASDAVREVNRKIVSTSNNGLGVEIAKRAIIQSFYSDQRDMGFVEALFSEVTNYLVSRDLSPLIGTSNRLKTVSDAIVLKDKIGARVQEIVRNQGNPPRGEDNSQWQTYVLGILEELRQ